MEPGLQFMCASAHVLVSAGAIRSGHAQLSV